MTDFVRKDGSILACLRLFLLYVRLYLPITTIRDDERFRYVPQARQWSSRDRFLVGGGERKVGVPMRYYNIHDESDVRMIACSIEEEMIQNASVKT